MLYVQAMESANVAFANVTPVGRSRTVRVVRTTAHVSQPMGYNKTARFNIAGIVQTKLICFVYQQANLQWKRRLCMRQVRVQ